MNLEGLTISLLTDKLQKELLSSKIFRVFMPNNYSLLLLLKRNHDTIALLADFASGKSLLYLPEQLPERPETPPAFCMLLRKHLEEGRITQITQSGLDRIITFEIDTIGAARQIITKKLIFELTGKNSNIIFTIDNIIQDSLKHINKSVSSFRQILPNLEYLAPPVQTGLPILTSSAASISKAVVQTHTKAPLAAFIHATTGIGKITATELFNRSGIDPQTDFITKLQEENLTNSIHALQTTIEQQLLSPTVIYAIISKTNQVKSILPFSPQLIAPENTVLCFNNINAAINYAVSLTPTQLPEQELLQKQLHNEITKTEKKLLFLTQELQNAENAEQQKIIADTLMANLYQLPKGENTCSLINIYDGTTLNIPLSPLLTPNENAQAYYKRYNKLKRAQTEIKMQIATTQENLLYFSSLDASLLTVSTKTELSEIKQEFTNIGLLQPTGKKSRISNVKSQPLKLTLSPETTLFIGKNNKQNESVTFEIGRSKDLWFHTKNLPGSHVILKTTLSQPLLSDIGTAVQLAAYFSKARTGSNIPVDCTEKRFVKKINGAKPGLVTYTNQTTYYTTPSESTIQKLLQQKENA